MTSIAAQLFLNDQFRDSSGGRRIPQVNPATEEVFTEASSATLSHVGAAVEGGRAGVYLGLACRASSLIQVKSITLGPASALKQALNDVHLL